MGLTATFMPLPWLSWMVLFSMTTVEAICMSKPSPELPWIVQLTMLTLDPWFRKTAVDQPWKVNFFAGRSIEQLGEVQGVRPLERPSVLTRLARGFNEGTCGKRAQNLV
jgi:hypothetical protein